MLTTALRVVLGVAVCCLGGLAAGCRVHVPDDHFACDSLSAHPCPGDMICAAYGNQNRCFHPGVWSCGNGRLDPGEQCDDQEFNEHSCSDYGGRPQTPRCSDQCTVICCGNGKIEGNGVTGEECDDGNERSHDGCSSACVKETPTWSPHDGGWEQGRIGHTLAYFPPRGTVIMFGGGPVGEAAPLPYGGTWEYDGISWRRLEPPVSPPARWMHEMVYDSGRQRLVIFGGVDAERGELGDTWEYDGDTWAPVAVTTPGPAPRYGHAMAYDSRRGVTVLYGGTLDITQVLFHADTWEFDGVGWTDRTAAVGAPPPVAGHTLTYDVEQGRTVLMGGTVRVSDMMLGSLETLWRYDGAGWADSGELVKMSVQAAVYDGDRRRVVVMGAPDQGQVTAQLYFWDGAAFESRATYVAPGERTSFELAYDPVQCHVVLFGGGTTDIGFNTIAYSDTWVFDGHEWSDAAPVVGPMSSSGALSVAFDPRALRLLVVTATERGEPGEPDVPSETWAFDENDLGWRQLPVASPPGAVRGGPMIYDDVRGRFLLFGVEDPATGVENQTWTFDGANWELLPTVDPPQVNGICARLIYDEFRQRALLVAVDLAPDGDLRRQVSTYVLEGAQWRQLDSPALPVVGLGRPCPEAQMLYDSTAGRPLLVGNAQSPEGQVSGVRTWAHDGEAWTELATVTSPEYSRTNLAAFAHDPTFNRSLLFVRTDDFAVHTWELRDLNWVETTTASGPVTVQAQGYLAYDWSRRSTVLVLPRGVGGLLDASWTFDVWEYRHFSSGPVEDCTDPFDDDEDGDALVNCEDPDCDYEPVCQ